MNPPTVEYRDTEELNAALRGRFRTVRVPYISDVGREVDTLEQQVNSPRTVVDREVLQEVVEFAHRSRQNEGWPTLSTRNLTIVCEHSKHDIPPQGALRNVLRSVAGRRDNAGDAINSMETAV